MLAIGSSPAASIVAKVTVTTALGLIAAWLARSNRASVRHALLAAMFGAMLLLPIASFVMPPLHVGLPAGVQSRAALPALMTGVDADSSVAMAGASTHATLVTPQALNLSPFTLLLVGWAAGAALFLLPVAIGLFQIRSLRRSGLPWRHGQPVVEALALDAGIHRHVEVLLHEALPGPMTCGVVRPAIVLPRDAENWNQEDLNRALVHELEHVRRGDSVSRCLARIACAVYWFHPLVWVAWRRFTLEAERSCDDAVLGRSEATAYARQLVGLAERLSMTRRAPIVALADRSDLATRVRALLDARQRRGRAGTFSLALACAAAVVLVLAMSPITLVAAPQPQPTTALTFEVASVRPNPAKEPPGDIPINADRSPGHFAMRDKPLRFAIEWAYDLKDYQIAGPEWIQQDERYDITANAPGPATDDQMRPMLQALLADRFQMKSHIEKRELDVYALVKGKGEPKLKKADPNSAQSLGPGDQGRARFNNFPLSRLTFLLTRRMDRPALDLTGITSNFDYEVDLSGLGRKSGSSSGYDGDGPSVFQAIEEDMGLKLEPRKYPVDVLVIDSVNKVPSRN
jgi:uncharacterized protein (TIGR03435 family)